MRRSENIELSNVATAKSGFTFRGKVPESENGQVSVIQPKDIDNGRLIQEPAKISKEGINIKSYLEDGDVLISNKGIRFNSFLYNGIPKLTIASASFFIITSNQKFILPKYLQWSLGQPYIKDYLLSATKGTTIPTFAKSTLEKIKIYLPEIEIQQKIIELLFEVEKEKKMMEDLIAKRASFSDSYIWELITPNNGN